MKCIRALVIASAIILSFQSTMLNAYADITAHKNSLKSAQTIIDSNKKEALQSKWYPAYHFAAQSGLTKHPNALTYFNGKYHLFYQNELTDASGKKMQIWAHATSTDLLNWNNIAPAIAPSEPYDNNGVFAGSAIVEDDLLNVFYTGYTENKENDKTQKKETPNLAMSKDGINFGKSANNPLIQMAPHYANLEFTKEYFKDPYVWKQSDRYYALIASQYEKTKDGAVLLFKSKDMRNWVFINITAIGSKGEMGHLWDCPNFLHIGNDDLLIINPTGIKPNGKMYLNKYISGGFLGKLDYNTGNFKQKGAFRLFDYGFDFYAPQVIKTADGRYVMIGWLGMPGSILHEESQNWGGMMTLPREIQIINGNVITRPLAELKNLRESTVSFKDLKIHGEKDFSNIKAGAYELEMSVDLTNAKNFKIKLRASSSQETVLSYDKDTQLLKLNRDKSGHALKGEREVKLPLQDNLLNLRIFVDNSSVEVFANDIAMTARIYPDKASAGIKISSEGEAILKNIDFHRLKSTHNEK